MSSARVFGRFPRYLWRRGFKHHSTCSLTIRICGVAELKHVQRVENCEHWKGTAPKNRRFFSSEKTNLLDPLEYEKLSEETLEELSEYLENCFENINIKELDINFSSGVLTIALGKEFGTYVINKQSPNKQIWLSSPTSGPKRYDFVEGQWVYGHDGSVMHDLLEKELTEALKYNFDLKSLLHYRFVK